jgi:hypothetical protein
MIVGSITKGNCKFRASGDYLFHVMMFKQARVVVEMRKVWHINWLMQMLHLGRWGLKPHIRMKINHPENELKDKKTPSLSKQNEATAAENGLQSVLRWRRSQQPSDAQNWMRSI